MFHLIWYLLIGLIAGVIAKSVMHVHIAIFWTVVLGIIGSILGGGLSHMFSRATNEDIIPPASFFPPWAPSWFCSFAISCGFTFRRSSLAPARTFLFCQRIARADAVILAEAFMLQPFLVPRF